MSDNTFILINKPGSHIDAILEGIGTIFDFGGNLTHYNTSASGKEADIKAIRSDWRAVGDDIRASMRKFRGAL